MTSPSITATTTTSPDTLVVTGIKSLGVPADIVATAVPTTGGSALPVGTLSAQPDGPYSISTTVPPGNYTVQVSTSTTLSSDTTTTSTVPPSPLTVTGNNTLGAPANIVVTATPSSGGAPITIGTLTAQPVGPFSVTAPVPPGGYNLDTSMTATLTADVPSTSTVPQPTLTVTGNNGLGVPADIVVTATPVVGGTPITIGRLTAQPVGPFSVTAVVTAGSYTTNTVMTVSAVDNSPTAVPPSSLTVTGNNTLGAPANIAVTATPSAGGAPITIGTLTAQPAGPFSVTAPVPPGGYNIDTNMTATLSADVPSTSTVPQPTLTVTGNNTLGAPANIVVTAKPSSGGAPITVGTLTAQPVGPFSVTAVVPAGSYTTDVSMSATLSASATTPATVSAPGLQASTFPGVIPTPGSVVRSPPMPAAGYGQIGAVAFRPLSTTAATPACTVTFAHPFADGALPAGSGMTIGGVPAQVDVFKSWPSGNVKHAGVTIEVPAMTTSQWTVGMMVPGTGATGTMVALAADPTTVTITNSATQVQLASVDVAAAFVNALGGTGSGGSVTCTISSGVVQSLTITNGGAGRTPGTYNLEFLTGYTPGLRTASGTYTVNSSGVIASVSLTSGGSGYTVAPIVRIPSVSYLRKGPLVTEGRVRISVPTVSPEFELVVDLACFGDGVTSKRMDIGFCREQCIVVMNGTPGANYGPSLMYDTTITVNGSPTSHTTVGATSTTSSSSPTIAMGSLTITIPAGIQWGQPSVQAVVPGSLVYIAATEGSANYMLGTVTSYSGTTLVANITSTGGSGTLTTPTVWFAGHDLYQVWHHVVNEDVIHVVFDTNILRATGAMINRNDLGVAWNTITGDNALQIGSTAFTPLGGPVPNSAFLNGLTRNMQQTSDRDDLGVTTMANTCWLITQDRTVRTTALWQAEAAGSLPLHFRDVATGKYIWVEDWPLTDTAPTQAGQGHWPQAQTRGGQWLLDPSHWPNTSSWPWMLTGRRKWWDDLEAIIAYQLTNIGPGGRKYVSTFTASGSGTTLTVSGTPTNPIWPGAALTTMTGIPAGTVIVKQLSGPLGQAGQYQTSNATTVAGASVTATAYYNAMESPSFLGSSERGEAWALRDLAWSAYIPDASLLTHMADGTAGQANCTYLHNYYNTVAPSMGDLAVWNHLYSGTTGRFGQSAPFEGDYFIAALTMASRMGYAEAGTAASQMVNCNCGVMAQAVHVTGSGAVITATVTGGYVTGLTVTSAGSGYTPGTYALGATGGGGVSFFGTYTVDSTNTVVTARIVCSGHGYTSAPTIMLLPTYDPYWGVIYSWTEAADMWGNAITTWLQCQEANYFYSTTLTTNVTVSGTTGTGNSVTLTFQAPDLNSGAPIPITINEVAGDTSTTVATKLTNAVNANTNLFNYGVYAWNNGAANPFSLWWPGGGGGHNTVGSPPTFVVASSVGTTITLGTVGIPVTTTLTPGAYNTGSTTLAYQERLSSMILGQTLGNSVAATAYQWFSTHPDPSPYNVTQVLTAAFNQNNPKFAVA